MNDGYKNTGALWKNDRRERQAQPHFTGSVNVEGEEYWVSCWWHKDRRSNASPVFTFSINPKDKRKTSENKNNEPIEDDISF